MIGVTADRIRRERSLFGPILETFAVNEMLRLSTWSDVQTNIHHYRDNDQDDVDVVLEDETGHIAGFEIKAEAIANSPCPFP